MRKPITEKDFKSIVTGLAEKKKLVDHTFRYIYDLHYEVYGLHLYSDQKFTKLNKIIHNATLTTHRRGAPANFVLQTIRANFREQAKAFAMLASNIKLALPKFSIQAGEEKSLQDLLIVLGANEACIKPISRWSKDLKGTILIHFMSLDGLKYLA